MKAGQQQLLPPLRYRHHLYRSSISPRQYTSYVLLISSPKHMFPPFRRFSSASFLFHIYILNCLLRISSLDVPKQSQPVLFSFPSYVFACASKALPFKAKWQRRNKCTRHGCKNLSMVFFSRLLVLLVFYNGVVKLLFCLTRCFI